jgi:hypothetical protein
MGAKFLRFTATWNIKGCSVYLTNMTDTVTDGILVIETKKYTQWQKTQQRKEYKKAVEGL